MLTEFRLQNFKALRDVVLGLGRINVLIGPNGSGKSSVLQALVLLKQSLQRNALITEGKSLNLGSFEGLVHRQRAKTPVEFELTHDFISPTVPGLAGGRVESAYKVEFTDGVVSLHEQRVKGPAGLEAKWSTKTGERLSSSSLELDGGGAIHFGPSMNVGQAVVIAGSSGVHTDATLSGLESYLGSVSALLSKTFLVPTVRGWNSPSLPLQPGPSDDFLSADGPEEYASRVLSTIAYRRELEGEISDFSQRALGVRIRVTLIPDKRVAAQAYNGSAVNLVNEGFGANQLLVLLAQVVIAPSGSVLGIEEPEIHLHPQAQGALAEIFAEVVREGDKQVLLTTHSEHLLMGLLTLVASGELAAHDLRVYYFEKDKEGVATAKQLTVDDQGRLKGGLKGFFETNVSELGSYLEALSGEKIT